MKKILLIGKDGQIGWELHRSLITLGEVIPFGHREFDLTYPDKIRSILREIKPQVIVNAAGYTAVDKAETEREIATEINAVAPGILAEEAKHLKALLIHYSSDYIFNGKSSTPYREEDKPNPLNFYGSTKLAGEQAVQAMGEKYLIFRTSWVYGLRGKNFLTTLLQMEKEKQEIKVVNDQLGAPTWSRLIAEATSQIISQDPKYFGIYHLSSAGVASWYEFAKSFVKKPAHIAPISTLEYSSKTIRPPYSVLSNEKVFQDFGIALPHWQKGLELAVY